MTKIALALHKRPLVDKSTCGGINKIKHRSIIRKNTETDTEVVAEK
jgi:hypothetical protein